MLMPAVVSSLIFIKRRPMLLEVFPSGWRKLWKKWEMRGLILLSLTTQILLILLGKRRKYIAGAWIRIIVWSAYLFADIIATLALGILSNDRGEIYNTNKELAAFWAPLFLLHLGGTDSITAYSLEDNELWTRHSFSLICQAVGALYILLMAWTGSRISIIFILMFVAGLIKYLERVWVLYSASKTEFKKSIPDTTDANKKDESKLKLQAEVLSQAPEALKPHVLSVFDADSLVKAYGLLDMVKQAFADYPLTEGDRKASELVFKEATMSYQKAFKIVEIELAFMYDLLYTKATVIYSYLGIAQRIICICLTFVASVIFFCTYYYHHYSEVDISITFILLAVAVFLELFAFVQLVFSDQATHWLIKQKRTTILGAIRHLQPLFQRRRWSNSMGQYSLLSFSLREKPMSFHGILNRLPFREKLETTPVQVTNDLKEFLFDQVKSSFSQIQLGKESNKFDPKTFFSRRGGRTLEKFKDLFKETQTADQNQKEAQTADQNQKEAQTADQNKKETQQTADQNKKETQIDLDWSTQLEFDQSILVWHLATEICHFKDYVSVSLPSINQVLQNSKIISQYMLYLLVKHPNTLSLRMGKVRFCDVCAEVRDFIGEQFPSDKWNKQEACKKLIAVKMTAVKFEEEKTKLVLLDALRVSTALMDIKNSEDRWNVIMNIWLEMLGYAANQCRGINHAKQLQQGGELLTHFWLLMVHFGLTEHFAQ